MASWGERRRRRDIERLLRKLDRLDSRAATRSRHAVDWHGRMALVLTVALIAGALIAVPGLLPVPLRQLAQLGPGDPTGTDSFAFLDHQRGDASDPVAWDPCRAISYVVNPAGGPSGAIELVEQAVDRVEQASGLSFQYAGETDARPRWDAPVLPGRGSDGAVLITWADPDELPDLSGDTAGVGGSIPAEGPDGRLRYVSGEITLDAGTFDRLAKKPGGGGAARAIVLHEFGHVLGLAHVKDRDELMNDDNLGLRDFGPGDLAGLARLSQVPCS